MGRQDAGADGKVGLLEEYSLNLSADDTLYAVVHAYDEVFFDYYISRGGNEPGQTTGLHRENSGFVNWNVTGDAIMNQEEAQGILFADVFSQILSVINNRRPHDPNDKPVLLIIDEVPIITEIPGMAKEKEQPHYLYL